MTLWRDEPAMRAYRNTSAHARAMPLLIGVPLRLSLSKPEAAVTHWQADPAVVPEPAEVAERMRAGRTSKLRHPSAAHAAGEAWPDGKVPVRGPGLEVRVR